MKTKLFIACSTVGAVCLTVAISRAADQKDKNSSDSSSSTGETVAKPMTEKQRKAQEKKLRKELETPYKKWLNEDVGYIITDEERKAFKQLQTDEERQAFVEQFCFAATPPPTPKKTSSRKST